MARNFAVWYDKQDDKAQRLRSRGQDIKGGPALSLHQAILSPLSYPSVLLFTRHESVLYCSHISPYSPFPFPSLLPLTTRDLPLRQQFQADSRRGSSGLLPSRVSRTKSSDCTALARQSEVERLIHRYIQMLSLLDPLFRFV